MRAPWIFRKRFTRAFVRAGRGSRASGTLRYGGAFPAGPMFEGAYVDDQIVLATCEAEKVAEDGACDDLDRLTRARAAYG